MMNAYEKAKQLTAKWEQERKDNKRLATMKEAERRIQVREFDNMLCLSLDGVPVLPMSEFNKQTLADARLTFFNYLIDGKSVWNQELSNNAKRQCTMPFGWS